MIGDPHWSNIEERLEEEKYFVSPEAKRIISLNKDKVVGLQEMELFLFEIDNISPKTVSSLDNFFSQAEIYGYGRCPMEVGPYLRLAVKNQNPGYEFCVGMDPVEDSFGSQVLFSIKQTGQYEKGTRRVLGVVKADSSYIGGLSPKRRIFLSKLS